MKFMYTPDTYDLGGQDMHCIRQTSGEMCINHAHAVSILPNDVL